MKENIENKRWLGIFQSLQAKYLLGMSVSVLALLLLIFGFCSVMEIQSG